MINDREISLPLEEKISFSHSHTHIVGKIDDILLHIPSTHSPNEIKVDEMKFISSNFFHFSKSQSVHNHFIKEKSA